MKKTGALFFLMVTAVAAVLIAPSSGKFIEKFGGTCTESFQWMNDCRYETNVLEIKTGISSLMQCGRDCFKNKDCNTFTFAASTCSLRNITDPNELYTEQFSICGLIPNRIPKSICQWQTSEDGSYQWADNCLINYFSGCEAQQVGFLNPCNSTRICAEACLANPNCNYFYFRKEGSYNRVGDYDCIMEKCTFLTVESVNSHSINSGFIVARKYNVEFIPNYCDLK